MSNQQIADDLLAMLRGEDSSNGSSAVEFNAGSFLANTATHQTTNTNTGTFISQIELQILRSLNPIDITETEEISIFGNKGIWVNRAEVMAWRGDLSINDYQINEDSNPEIITKRIDRSIEYVQELAIRYLRPPTPPNPGEIIITMEANLVSEPAPPLIIRQQPARASTPEPLVVREAPPEMPASVGIKRITISGKRLPPPPRKVIIERLAPLPSKPQNVIIERWLPYSEVKRRVIFNRSSQPDPIISKPRNVIVQWEAPQVQIKKEIKYLGVIRANPAEYIQRYGSSLKASNELPQFVLDIQTPQDLVLAADYRYSSVYELEGQLEAFQYVDLDREGLAEYRIQLERRGIRFNSSNGTGKDTGFNGAASTVISAAVTTTPTSPSLAASAVISAASSSGSASASGGNIPVEQIFRLIDKDNSGYITVEEAGRILLRVNSRLGRSYGEDNITELFKILDKNGDGRLNLAEFSAIFNTLKSA